MKHLQIQINQWNIFIRTKKNQRLSLFWALTLLANLAVPIKVSFEPKINQFYRWSSCFKLQAGCEYKSNRKNNLQRHKETMHHKREVAFHCCAIRFYNRAEFDKHKTEKHSQGYSCQVISFIPPKRLKQSEVRMFWNFAYGMGTIKFCASVTTISSYSF